MWICPDCNREFKKNNQQHYCGDKPNSIDEYIATQAESTRADLTLIRNILRDALSDAQEKISWSMPTYWKGRNVIHFAASKHHIGIYPGASTVEHFTPQLKAAGYSFSKGTIRVPYGQVQPELIRAIGEWCAGKVQQ